MDWYKLRVNFLSFFKRSVFPCWALLYLVHFNAINSREETALVNMEELFPETAATDNGQSCHQNKEDLNHSQDPGDSQSNTSRRSLIK